MSCSSPARAPTLAKESLLQANAWPFIEAKRLKARYEAKPSACVTFCTGYGPSGLPHIGTWGEVFRTTLVRQAFSWLCPGVPTELIAFSDDRDGLRKIPENVPHPELLTPHLGKPLTDVPDPYAQADSFGAYNNAQLCRFLNQFGFDYRFISATAFYQSGAFDPTLKKVAQHHDTLKQIILPTLGKERQQTYSPFLPICPLSGKVLYVPVTAIHCADDTLTYTHPELGPTTQSYLQGACKLQWKVDWAMRWANLGVDYEMSGKDLSESVRLASKLCQAVGALPPVSFTYELNLDEHGQKISKSKGNGLALETWLHYAPQESLAGFMFRRPGSAKRVGLSLLARETDEYLQHAAKFAQQSPKDQLENPVFHIHAGNVPARPKVSYSLLTNLASLCLQSENSQTDASSDPHAVLSAYLSRYDPSLNVAADPWLADLCRCALAFAQDQLLPNRHIVIPDNPDQRDHLRDLANTLDALDALNADADEDAIQTAVFDVGKRYGYAPLSTWFRIIYQVLFGAEQGPKLGAFFRTFGLKNSVTLLRARCELAADTREN